MFNSFGQRFAPLLKAAKAKRPKLQYGLRINPVYSEGAVPLYDSCSPGSRLGTLIW